ncbi:MAG: hypothetical protein WCA57_18595 [Ilumatobacteraceae bacterium]|jgi:hypothetical protein
MISTRLIPAVLLAALAVSCGGSGGEGGGGDAIDLADTFASAEVCNGEANENVPDPTASNVYTYLNDGSGWSTAWFSLFGVCRPVPDHHVVDTGRRRAPRLPTADRTGPAAHRHLLQLTHSFTPTRR